MAWTSWKIFTPSRIFTLGIPMKTFATGYYYLQSVLMVASSVMWSYRAYDRMSLENCELNFKIPKPRGIIGIKMTFR